LQLNPCGGGGIDQFLMEVTQAADGECYFKSRSQARIGVCILSQGCKFKMLGSPTPKQFPSTPKRMLVGYDQTIPGNKYFVCEMGNNSVATRREYLTFVRDKREGICVYFGRE